jgi:uncharacterized protein YhhL (DUF1145 family)
LNQSGVVVVPADALLELGKMLLDGLWLVPLFSIFSPNNDDGAIIVPLSIAIGFLLSVNVFQIELISPGGSTVEFPIDSIWIVVIVGTFVMPVDVLLFPAFSFVSLPVRVFQIELTSPTAPAPALDGVLGLGFIVLLGLEFSI